MQLLYSKIKFQHQNKKPKSLLICIVYYFIRDILFRFDAEKVHHFSMKCLKFFFSIPLFGHLLKATFKNSGTPVSLCGINFPNIVGLAAGFDKNALYLKEIEALGFGSVEIGTVTPLPQNGNDTPRLFRLPDDKAIVNRMGFNNDGAQKIAIRLQNWKKKNSQLIIGANIGKNKNTANENAWQDYEKCFLILQPHADYVVVNVSSPNTPGLRDLQTNFSLEKILNNLVRHNRRSQIPKPLFLKLSPDIDLQTFDEILELCINIGLDGVIISNTTISRENLKSPSTKIQEIGAGGLSGKPLIRSSTDLVKYAHEKIKNKMVIIASGGIFNEEDAKQKLSAGASLIQVWTGFIYEGPYIVKKMLRNI